MKKILSTLAIIFLALFASPFLLFGLLLVLGAGLAVILAGVGLIAVVISWLIPLAACIIAVAGIAYAISLLIDDR